MLATRSHATVATRRYVDRAIAHSWLKHYIAVWIRPCLDEYRRLTALKMMMQPSSGDLGIAIGQKAPLDCAVLPRTVRLAICPNLVFVVHH